MAHSLAETYHKTIIRYYLDEQHFTTGGTPEVHMRELEAMLNGMSIAKCTLDDFERNEPKGPLHLMYLLQKEQGLDFGLCPFFKIWNNRDGAQQRCYHDQGRGIPIQVGCGAKLARCERKAAYEKFKETSDSYAGIHLPVLRT